MVVSYVNGIADQVLYSSYTLDIYSDNDGSCIFAQDRALEGEVHVKAKEYSRSTHLRISALHCSEYCSYSHTPM